MNKKRTIASSFTLVLVIAAFFILRSFIEQGSISSGNVSLLNFIGINIIAAVSLNLVTGLLGQLVLGHAGFMLVGAYTAAIFVNTMEGSLELPFALPVGLALAGLTAAVFGILIGIPALRLRGDYLAIITLGFGEIIRVVANALSFTNGAKGYRGFPNFSIRREPVALFSFIFVVAALVIFFSYTFGTSRHGRSVIAIREDEIAAENSGINTTYYKLMTFAFSAFFAGVAGGLYAFQTSIIDPSNYGFNRSVEILMMVVLGGMGSITGSALSASTLTVLPEMLRGFSEYRMLIYSAMLILVMLFRPKGLLGRAEIRLIKPLEKITGLFRGKSEPPKGAKGGGKS